MDDENKPSDSSWKDSSFLYGSEQENSILSEFGWDFSGETRSVTELDQIQDSNCAASYLYPEPETRSYSTSNSNQMILSDPVHPSPSNPSFSSSSSDDLAEKSTGSVEKPPDKPSKARKKGQKRTRQPRFAFITKTDVDHLEDGYRWRKYGQKAVKNSPYPRSYYRCTNSKCTVKKRVERSSEDPSTVITTYEGQHCHHTVSFPRGGIFSHDAAFMGRLNSSVSQMYVPGVQYPIGGSLGLRQSQQLQHEGSSQIQPEPTSQLPSDEGLLGDIVPAGMRNR